MQDKDAGITCNVVQDVLKLQQVILKRIPLSVTWLSRPNISDKSENLYESAGPLEDTCSFYGLVDTFRHRPRSSQVVPFAVIFEDLICITMDLARSLFHTPNTRTVRELFVYSLALLVAFVGRLEQMQGAPLIVNWDPAAWSSLLLQCLVHKVRQLQ